MRPVFAPGDALLFDELLLHRTAAAARTQDRYAIESWFFARLAIRRTTSPSSADTPALFQPTAPAALRRRSLLPCEVVADRQRVEAHRCIALQGVLGRLDHGLAVAVEAGVERRAGCR